MVVEMYGNKITTPKTGARWLQHRGSWGMYFDNSLVTQPGYSTFEIDQYPSGCTNLISPSPSSKYIPEVNNTYVFNNTVNGSMINMLPGPTGNNCGTSENGVSSFPLGYWNYNLSCLASSCTAGIGRGTIAPTGSCTKGVGYWVSSIPTPIAPGANGDPAKVQAIQNGHFYKCTSPNHWELYYTPYAYPHPLRTKAP